MGSSGPSSDKRCHMYFREVIFGQEQEIPKEHVRVGRIVLFATFALLVGVAWHYGIITSLALILRDLLAAVWNILSDVATSLGDLLHYLLR